MRKLSIGAALVAAAIAVPLSIGSSHREAPNISLDPTADNTDVYAFTAKDAPGALTVVANWIPGYDESRLKTELSSNAEQLARNLAGTTLALASSTVGGP